MKSYEEWQEEKLLEEALGGDAWQGVEKYGRQFFGASRATVDPEIVNFAKAFVQKARDKNAARGDKALPDPALMKELLQTIMGAFQGRRSFSTTAGFGTPASAPAAGFGTPTPGL
jgi:hypothetical protein